MRAIVRPLLLGLALLALASCGASKGSDAPPASPCACAQIEYDGSGYQWLS